jgi:hypothetical protein
VTAGVCRSKLKEVVGCRYLCPPQGAELGSLTGIKKLENDFVRNLIWADVTDCLGI